MKVLKVIFIIIFMTMIGIPWIFAYRGDEIKISEENRILSPKAHIFEEGNLNYAFTYDYEDWFLDNLGFRQKLTDFYARLQYFIFDNIFDQNMYMGKTGDLIYASDEMLRDYQHLNLRDDTSVERIGKSYQIISDWLQEKEIAFYYVQCFDKHSIYPERFMRNVNQYGNISKTDQIIKELKEETTVNVISLKDVLLSAKTEYPVFSRFGDPTHWSPGGAIICYQYVMNDINKNGQKYKILSKEDYTIKEHDMGKTIKGNIHFEEWIEGYTVNEPNAQQVDSSILGKFAEDKRHTVWKNSKADNGERLLIVGDSYFDGYVIPSIAESFSETYMIWGDYVRDLEDMVELLKPTVVIFESAERVDRSEAICELAVKLNS